MNFVWVDSLNFHKLLILGAPLQSVHPGSQASTGLFWSPQSSCARFWTSRKWSHRTYTLCLWFHSTPCFWDSSKLSSVPVVGSLLLLVVDGTWLCCSSSSLLSTDASGRFQFGVLMKEAAPSIPVQVTRSSHSRGECLGVGVPSAVEGYVSWTLLIFHRVPPASVHAISVLHPRHPQRRRVVFMFAKSECAEVDRCRFNLLFLITYDVE